MSAIGFLPYLAFIFLPGVGLGELLGVWGAKDGFTARLAYSFGIGLGVDSLVLIVRTAGITGALTGIDSLTVYSTIGSGLVLLLASVALRRKLSWWVTPSKLDVAFLGILLLQCLVIILYFQKYPIFPNFVSQDYLIHVRNTEGLITGANVTIPRGVLYDGVYYQTSPALVLVGGSALITIRSTMAILAILSPLLFYLAAQRLTGSEEAGIVSALLYALSGALWFGMVFISGLYSNFFGVLAALFLLVVFLDAVATPTAKGVIALLVLTTVMAYFSHFSVITLLPAILAYPFIRLLEKRKLDWHPFLPLAIIIVPGLAGLALYPHILFRLFLANRLTASVFGSTALSAVLSPFPVLGYLAVSVYSDIGFVLLAALACVFVWRLLSSRVPMLSILLIWFMVLLAIAPLNAAAWRYALEALVPLSLMAGIGLFSLFPRSKAAKGRQNPRGYYWRVGLVLFLVLTPMFADSWGAKATGDAVTDTSLVAQSQSLVNQSISWLGSNTPPHSTFLSVSDQEFFYTKFLIGRPSAYAFESTPAEALQAAQQVNASYIIVTNYINGDYLPSDPSLYPWNNFPASGSVSNMTLVYQNPDVRIFQVK